MSTPQSPGHGTGSFLTQIGDAVRCGDEFRAYELASAALESGLRHPAFFDVRWRWLAKSGRHQEALRDLEMLDSHVPGDTRVLVTIGHMLIRLRRPEEAVARLDAAIAIQPQLAQAHYERGVALGILGETDAMRLAHERTIELEPDNADALASLALIAARSGDATSARAYAAPALALKPRAALARAALAVTDILEGDFTAADQKLDLALAEASPNDTWLDVAVADAADALDRRDEIARAFAAYAAVGERRRQRELPSVRGSRMIDAVLRRADYFRTCGAWTPPASSSDPVPARGHVFLLGFMRSGTTLLETILASSPDVCASDEREFLAEPARQFLFNDEGLDRLAVLDERELARWRNYYWSAIENAGFATRNKVFVNKQPFNSLRLPLIARLFPEARIVLAVRDPRDVVFSCFRHRFEPNPLTFEFLRLDDCARFYAATMELVALCRPRLTLRLHEHHYETIIDRFEECVRGVCDFTGIDWSESMREFVAASGVISRRSQSAAQVRRGLYSGGIGQWRRYRKPLGPVFPVLRSWVERFGYPDA
ncbi:MAG TPA: sulfotransferase [Rhizomicrobium sp.]|jgi:Flp pilus assembly protein TadD|nr:sulfotransferase [Rhizomicrobium sp.]